MGKPMDVEEEKLYIKEKQRLKKQIDKIESDIAELKKLDEKAIEDLEGLFACLTKFSETYARVNYVQKRKFCDLFFSNIKITPDLSLQIAIKEELLPLFDTTWWTGRDSFFSVSYDF